MKKIICFFMIFIIVLLIGQISFAKGTTTDDLFKDTTLQEINQSPEGFNSDTGIGGAINTIIGLLQIAGTGISILTVTMLGIKYMLASVGEKAEIKKQALPIVIGCVLLFGAVNLMAIVENFSNTTVNN